MLNNAEVMQLTAACKQIGDDVADEQGFVPVRSLLQRFRAELVVRPLLVEAMLAIREHGPGEQSSYSTWVVVVDRERHPFSASELSEERYCRPLSPRFRNTVAHELAHSLAFRPSDFGLKLRPQIEAGKSRSTLVKEMEREIERLSPMLLCPPKAMASFVNHHKETLGAAHLADFCRRIGISRPLLVQRLNLIRSSGEDDLLQADALLNLGVGLVEWCDKGTAVFRNWPFFTNFDKHMVPILFRKALQQDRTPATSADWGPEFALVGGRKNIATAVSKAGTEFVPEAINCTIVVSVEDSARRPGSSSLFALRIMPV